MKGCVAKRGHEGDLELVRRSVRSVTAQKGYQAMRYLGEERSNRRVRVPSRDDIGEVVFDGVNIGTAYCVAVHFPTTGEVVYYLKDRVTTVEAGSAESSDQGD